MGKHIFIDSPLLDVEKEAVNTLTKAISDDIDKEILKSVNHEFALDRAEQNPMAKFHIPAKTHIWRYDEVKRAWSETDSTKPVAYDVSDKWSDIKENGHPDSWKYHEPMADLKKQLKREPIFFILPPSAWPYILIGVNADHVGLQLVQDSWMDM